MIFHMGKQLLFSILRKLKILKQKHQVFTLCKNKFQSILFKKKKQMFLYAKTKKKISNYYDSDDDNDFGDDKKGEKENSFSGSM